MRILYVSHSFPLQDDPLSNVGGMQRVAVDLHRALRADPRVALRSMLLESSSRMTGPRTPGFLAKLLARLPGEVHRHRAEVILFSSMVTASVVPAIAGRIRAGGAITAAIPVGRDVTLPNPLYQLFVPTVLRSLDLVLPISRATAATCLERGADPARVEVVPCGIDLDRIGPVPDRARARSELLRLLSEQGHEVPPDSLLLLSVGRHQERKGFHWFVDQVIPRLGSGVVHLIAGEGPMTPAIRARIAEQGVADRVILLGRVSDALLATAYAGSDLFIMPNIPVPGDIEGFGVVMLEAGALGLPVIAADLEGIRDVVTEGANGHLLPTGEASAFARTIEAYGRDRDSLVRAAEAAQGHVRGSFGWASVVTRYLTALTSAVRRGASEDPIAVKR